MKRQTAAGKVDLSTPAEERRLVAFLDSLDVGAVSRAAYLDDWKVLARWFSGRHSRSFDISALASSDAVRYRQDLLRTYTAATARRRLRFLVRYARSSGQLPGLGDVLKAPTPHRPPRGGPGAPRTLKAASVRDRAIVLVFLDAGLKISELCGLSRADVARAGLIVRGSKARTVKMSKRLATAMKAYLGRTPRSGPLFTGIGGRALSHWRVRHIAAASAGASPSQLRRMFADRYLEQTGDPLELARVLGRTFVGVRVGKARRRR